MNAEHEKSCFFKEIYLFPCQNCNQSWHLQKKIEKKNKKSCNFDTKYFIFFINKILIDWNNRDASFVEGVTKAKLYNCHFPLPMYQCEQNLENESIIANDSFL